MPIAVAAISTPTVLLRPSRAATMAGSPKMPLPITELIVREARLQRPIACTSPLSTAKTRTVLIGTFVSQHPRCYPLVQCPLRAVLSASLALHAKPHPHHFPVSRRLVAEGACVCTFIDEAGLLLFSGGCQTRSQQKWQQFRGVNIAYL